MTDRLGEIIKKTLIAIEAGKEEIFSIAENARSETQRLTQELSHLRVDIAKTIDEVDRQQKVEKRLRQRLMEVSRDYKRYSEEEMMRTYAEAKDSQVQLQLLQAMEVQQRTRRDDVERMLTQMVTTIERAENLMNKVGMAITLLEGGLSEDAQTKNVEQLQEISLRIIKAQEGERQRVARDIHDGPAQTLANIVLRLEIAEKLLEYDANKVKGELRDLKGLVRANLQDIRRIIFNLRPMALDEMGMVTAIRGYLNSFKETYGINYELYIEGQERRLGSALEITLFRLIQEALTNVAKHSNSKRAVVTLQYHDDRIIAQVKDFGTGFDVQETLNAPGEHFGLIGMRERVEMCSGHLSIKSIINKGTDLEVNIPCIQEGRKHNDSSSHSG